MPQEAQPGRHDAGERRVIDLGLQPERDDDQACDIVDAVTGLPGRYHAVRVLDDPDIVDQGEQVIGADQRRRGEIPGRRAVDRVPTAGQSLGQDVQGAAADRRPGQAGADPPRLLGRRGQLRRVVQQSVDGPGHGVRIVEWHQHSGARGQQVLGVVVGRGHHGATGHHGESQGTRNDLLA